MNKSRLDNSKLPGFTAEASFHRIESAPVINNNVHQVLAGSITRIVPAELVDFGDCISDCTISGGHRHCIDIMCVA